MNSSQIIKIVAIICFALIGLILIVLGNSPATGFESLIYAHTPSIVWGVLIFSIICGIGIILHQLYTKKEKESNLWIIGLLLIALSFTILFSVHALRGYALYGKGDSLTHLGAVRNIISSGFIERDNFYPVLHIYTVQLSQICNINPMQLFGYMPAFFAALFIPFMYIFARSVLPQKGQVILATVAGTSTLIVGAFGQVFSHPNSLADMLIPLVFFLCIRNLARDTLLLKVEFGVLLIIMLFLFPVFHPVPAFAILLMMVTLWLPIQIYNIWGKKVAKPIPGMYRVIAPAALMFFIWFVTWISSFFVWETALINIYTVIRVGGPSQLDAVMDTIDFATGYGYSVWEQFFKRYFDILIFIMLALISVPILFRKMSTSRNLGKLLSLYGPLLAFGLTIIILFGFNIQFGPGRLSRYAVIICAVFVGFVFYEVLERTRNTPDKSYLTRLWLSLMVLILVLLPVNGVFKTYYSRYTYTPSGHVALTDIKGADWFFNNKDIRLAFISYDMVPPRYADLLLTPEEKGKRSDIPGWDYPLLPWHFNYDSQSMLGESYTEDLYMVVTQNDRLQYVEVYPEVAEFRFYPSDFDKLETDPSIDKLYSNSGLEVWHVHPVVSSH